MDINKLIAENEALKADRGMILGQLTAANRELDEARMQEPDGFIVGSSRYLDADTAAIFESDISDGYLVYSAPVPAQQTINRQTIIDVLLSSLNLSEGVIADVIISAIGAQKSPAVSVPDDEQIKAIALSVSDNIFGDAYTEYNEDDEKFYRAFAYELLKCKSSPRITEQDAIDDLKNRAYANGVRHALKMLDKNKDANAAPPLRVTEQDAREIAYSALCSVAYDSEVYISEWMASKCPLLLNKLNGEPK